MRVCLNCGIVLCEVMKERERERERESVCVGGGEWGEDFPFFPYFCCHACQGGDLLTEYKSAHFSLELLIFCVFGFGVDLGYIKRFKSFARMICFFGRGGGKKTQSFGGLGAGGKSQKLVVDQRRRRRKKESSDFWEFWVSRKNRKSM